jgi:AcrR family transcriptional regulator
VLSAAAELFHRRGFHAVTMDDIGSAVGIAGPSIYRHFRGKQAILYAIARRAADRLATDADDAVRASATEADALHRLVASYLRVLTSSPELSVGFSIDTASLDDAERAELIGVQRDYVTRWAMLLQAVHPTLTLREAKVTAHAALSVANDLARARRFAGRPHLTDDLRALMAAALDV